MLARPLAPLLLGFVLLGGCGREEAPRQNTEQEQRIIERARRAVAQFDDWADRAEYKIVRRDSKWVVTAWRIEHPEAKGDQRYVPWGRRVITLDDAGTVLDYRTGK